MINFFLLLASSETGLQPPLIDVTASGSIKKVLLIGDSMTAAHECRIKSLADIFFTDIEKTQGFSATTIAIPGNTIQQQSAAWAALSNKTDFDAIFVFVGHNNCNPTGNTRQSNRIAYQELINSINVEKKQNARVISNALVPAKQRWFQLGWNESAQQLAMYINQDLKRAITGVYKVNDHHVGILDDGTGNLKSIYRCSDQFHINDDAATQIVRSMRFMIYN